MRVWDYYAGRPERLLLLVQTTIAFCLTQILGGFFHATDVPASWPFQSVQGATGIGAQDYTRLRHA